ncbi:MAG: DUF1828 domain-containing protein, partial [Acidobacteriota bacterium]
FDTTPSDDGCFITTPFIRSDGEAIELVAELSPDGKIRLSDMGDTLGYLYVNGLTLSRSILENSRRISRRHSVSLYGSEFVIEVEDSSQIGEALHQLIQTVVTTSDLIQKRRPTGRVNFDDEVESFVIVSGVIYDTDFPVLGVDNPYKIRFHVNSGRNLLIQPLSPASESNAFSWAERWAYRFTDIRGQDDKWRCVAVLDDRGQRSTVWSERVMRPLREYSIVWTERNRLLEHLTQLPLL